MGSFIIIFTKFLLLLVPVLLGVAFLTLFERKLLSLVGYRLGPYKVSLGGFLQPLGDAFKLSGKGVNLLFNFWVFYYYFSSALTLFSGLVLWSCFFSLPEVFSLKFSVLIIMICLGINSLNSIVCGWSTSSKYSSIGSMRTVAQLISYESVLYLCFFLFFFTFSSFSLGSYQGFALLFLGFPFICMVWFPSFLAELNRTPYDFSEGESELVSGFNTEFGSKSFTLLFLAEYSNIIFFCGLTSVLFFSGWYLLFLFLMVVFVVWIRSVLPRYRFDKLMTLAWKTYIPFLTLYLILIKLCIFF